VQRRLKHLAEFVDLKVVAPVAVLQYGKPKGKRLRLGRRGAEIREDGEVPVLRPHWFYPPLAGSAVPVWLFLQVAGTLRRIRQDCPFEVIDTHFGSPDGIAGALLSAVLGVPFTMTLRGSEPKHSTTFLGRATMAWALKRASRVFTVSDRLRQFAIGLGADAARVKTIPNGVDGTVFYERDRAACRRKHGLPVESPILLSAGALVERKGHHRVIHALSAIRRHRPDVQLIVAGGPGPEGALEEKLRELVTQFGMENAVRFTGAVNAETLADLMSAADVLCLASTNEGWPNVIHEALACGTPAVATDVGAVPDMLAGGNGIVVPVNDPEALSQALCEALQRKWDRAAIAVRGGSRTWRQVALEAAGEIRLIAAGNRQD
jgi:glycosyltransferase involved in cell wall biosynthesis